MLREIGASSIDDLFASIPPNTASRANLDIPRQMANPEIVDYFKNAAAQTPWLCQLPRRRRLSPLSACHPLIRSCSARIPHLLHALSAGNLARHPQAIFEFRP